MNNTSNILKYVVKRILLAVLILVGVSMIMYFLIRLMPTSYLENQFLPLLTTGNMSQEEFHRILALYGMDDNSFGGILKGYFGWLGKVLQGDLGISFQESA